MNEVGQYVRKVGAPAHSGGGNWLFSDTTSGGRNTAEVSRASGEVDGVRLPKEAYYVCQAMFRDDPQVHIIGHWTYPAGTKKSVYVASNCQDVELYVNGKSAGHGKRSDTYLFTFPDVACEPGEIKAVAFNNGTPTATNIIHTAGSPVALRLTSIAGPVGLQADGSDIALIDVEAVDANGERCPTFQKRVDFTCDGPAIWRGGYNSGVANSINNKHLDLECGINRVAVRSTLRSGEIIVTASCAGLKTGSITIQSHGVAITNGWSRTMAVVPQTSLPASHPDWSHLAKDSQPMTVVDASASTRAVGRFTDAFAYTGPTELVHVEPNCANGRNVYCDRDYAFTGLPQELTGADWVQAANADGAYSAADVMEIAVKAGTAVYVAHDRRLATPTWLANQFEPTKLSLSVNGQSMDVFVHHAKSNESVTLGSNAATSELHSANMYVVFIKSGEQQHE